MQFQIYIQGRRIIGEVDSSLTSVFIPDECFLRQQLFESTCSESRHLQLTKIDVEDADTGCLKGAFEVLPEHRPPLILE